MTGFSPVSVLASLRIMPMGDSITEWDCRLDAYTDANDAPVAPGTAGAFVVAPNGYRGYLGGMLADAGVSFDFVGSRHDRCGSNHEGWGGRTIEFLGGVAADAVSRHRPDSVLFMAGTNDFYFPPPVGVGTNVTEALRRLGVLLDAVYTASPSLTFLMSTVTKINATRCVGYPRAPWHPAPCPATMPGAIDAYNAALPSFVSAHRNRERRIRLHDVNAAAMWEPSDYWIWGIHFNASGFKKMAAAWFEALQAERRSPTTVILN